MRSLPVRNVVLDVCDLCGGVWFEGDELKKVARVFAWAIPGEPEKLAPIIAKNDIPDHERKNDLPYGLGVTCPIDSAPTERFRYAGDSRIVLDRCATCYGIWFDGDELVQLAEYLRPKTRDLLGKLMIEEMKNTEKMVKGVQETSLLPLKLVAAFSSPISFFVGLVYLLIRYGGPKDTWGMKKVL